MPRRSGLSINISTSTDKEITKCSSKKVHSTFKTITRPVSPIPVLKQPLRETPDLDCRSPKQVDTINTRHHQPHL
ncbi:hypothetical protein DPMN_050248 [Dreissena polymorpha]|uniref:Uncharacterized protein n=1 Tax=Dreissena polymorpha TaxID=45954 RepID=A0A9D4CH63_DREPO|nr:hypothetical protein DPMN_050248 [Dreissena polymorpha]